MKDNTYLCFIFIDFILFNHLTMQLNQFALTKYNNECVLVIGAVFCRSVYTHVE